MSVGSFVSLAIGPVCGPNPTKINRANNHLAKFSSDTSKLFKKLNKLCGGNFIEKAKNQGILLTQEENDEINGAYSRKGESVPDDIALKALVGSTPLELGTLRSFYSCKSLEDTSPTLIATGSSSLSGRALTDQQCNNWSYLQEWALSGSSKIRSDASSPHVYVSTNSTGNCHDAVGGLLTETVGIFDNKLKLADIPAIEVNCLNSACTTTETLVQDGYWGINYLIPSVSVTCIEETCTSAPITTSSYIQLFVRSQSFTCTSFPCTISSSANIPERVVTLSNNIYSTNAVNTDNNLYVIPSQEVTCDDTSCSTPSLIVDPKSLTIPEQSTICTGSSCTSIPSVTIADSTGISVTIPEKTITCSTNLCTAAEVSATQSEYTYYSPPQNVRCSGSSCTTPAQVLYAGADNYITIPSLTAGAVAATAGSLYALCMYETNH